MRWLLAALEFHPLVEGLSRTPGEEVGILGALHVPALWDGRMAVALGREEGLRADGDKEISYN